MMEVRIAGAGPAGACAALAAQRCGASVRLFDPSRFPRHKVCGEFISPEMVPLLQQLGLAEAFFAALPATVRRMEITLPGATKRASLSETAYGLSRYAFDALLLAGTEPVRNRIPAPEPGMVWTVGRTSAEPRGSRLFGFKAHFTGPQDDAVELFFADGCYLGINAVEGGRTNVCGLAREDLLRSVEFDPEELFGEALRRRLEPMKQEWKWLTCGPLRFGNHLASDEPFYRAGDAMSFVDPFTGSGMLCAVMTGILAGRHAAVGVAPRVHRQRCQEALGGAFRVSSLLRSAVGTQMARWLLPLVPGRLLYSLTRPRVTS